LGLLGHWQADPRGWRSLGSRRCGGEIIPEIRTADVNYYGKLRRICSFAQDDDAKSKSWQDFYAQMRAELFWAVVSHTLGNRRRRVRVAGAQYWRAAS